MIQTNSNSVETWVAIPESNGKHSASSYGRIRNNNSLEIIAKPGGKGAYLTAKVGDKSRSVHRIIAEIFLPNPDNLPEVNHKDLNKHNNHPDNLEWCTRSFNMNHLSDHEFATGKIRRGGRHKLTTEGNVDYALLQTLKPQLRRGDIMAIAKKANIDYSIVYTAFHLRPSSFRLIPLIHHTALQVLTH